MPRDGRECRYGNAEVISKILLVLDAVISHDIGPNNDAARVSRVFVQYFSQADRLPP